MATKRRRTRRSGFCALLVGLALSAAASGGEKLDKERCSFNGKPLYGKIKIVKDFPDVKVKVVRDFPDLKVKEVKDFPDKCGKWKLVDDFPDTKVKFVDDFPDVKVKFVENFPGVP